MNERPYHKLVRDNIPAIIRQQGETPITRTLDSQEYARCLEEKLREEVEEVPGGALPPGAQRRPGSPGGHGPPPGLAQRGRPPGQSGQSPAQRRLPPPCVPGKSPFEGMSGCTSQNITTDTSLRAPALLRRGSFLFPEGELPWTKQTMESQMALHILPFWRPGRKAPRVSSESEKRTEK